MWDSGSFDTTSFDRSSFAFGVDVAVIAIEFATAADESTTSAHGVASSVESLSVEATSVEVIVAARASAESVAPADLSAGVADGGADAIAAVTLSDGLAGEASNVLATIESAAAADHVLSVAVLLTMQSESIGPTDNAVAVLEDAASVIEIVTLAEAAVKSVLAQSGVIEVAAAGETSQLIADLDAAVNEAIAAADRSVTARTLAWAVPTSDRIARLKPITTIANVVKQRWM